MKRTMLLLCSLLAAITIGAAETKEVNAVYAWVNGTSKCYRLSDMPMISYENEGVVLSIGGVEQLRVYAEDIEQLTITYGVYKPDPNPSTNAEQTELSPVRKVGKYIIGGQLIIVIDGVQYDTNGHTLKINN